MSADVLQSLFANPDDGRPPGSAAAARLNLYEALGIGAPRTDLSAPDDLEDRPLPLRPRKNGALQQTALPPGSGSSIKRWDGVARTTASWDGLRKVRLPPHSQKPN